jgi:hypothetical protein
MLVVEVKQWQMSRLIERDESEFSALGVKDRRPNTLRDKWNRY